MLEDNTIKDSKNNTIYLNNNIIILTTNVGSEKKEIGFNSNKNKVISELKETFNLALINRIDDIINFNKLTKEDITKIININLKKLKNKYKNIEINIHKNIIDEIIDESKYQEFGARKIEKIIHNKLESIIIDNLIENKKTINIDSILSK